jgi:putative hydrolase of the HAD superfamily
MTVQAVFFDMGGTIETFSSTPELRLQASRGLRQRLLTAGIDLQLNAEQLLGVITAGENRYLHWKLQSMQELPPARVWREYFLAGYPIDSTALEVAAEDLMLYYETHFFQRSMRPEMPAVLLAIQQMGLKIGLISNVCSRGQVPLNLEQYGLRHYFDPVVLSSQYGRRKPDPAIFHHAARLAGAPTSRCLYVGDRIARDILGARRAGFGLTVQIRHHFDHGEQDTGAAPDAIIQHMDELLEILGAEKSRQTAPVPPGPIQAFLFDAGDVLYYRPRRGQKFNEFLAQLGLDAANASKAEKDSLAHQAYQGLISQDQYREALVRLYGVTELEQIERGKQAIASEDDDVQFFPGVAETLVNLKKMGYLLGIITDTANSVSTKLSWFEKGGFGHVWDSIISSKEIGARKPNPRLYQAALQQLGVSTEQAVFVGHKISELDGAHTVGLKTVAFNYDHAAQADYYIHNFSDLLSLPFNVYQANLQTMGYQIWR